MVVVFATALLAFTHDVPIPLECSSGKFYMSGSTSLAIAVDGAPFEVEFSGTGSILAGWDGNGRLPGNKFTYVSSASD